MTRQDKAPVWRIRRPPVPDRARLTVLSAKMQRSIPQRDSCLRVVRTAEPLEHFFVLGMGCVGYDFQHLCVSVNPPQSSGGHRRSPPRRESAAHLWWNRCAVFSMGATSPRF